MYQLFKFSIIAGIVAVLLAALQIFQTPATVVPEDQFGLEILHPPAAMGEEEAQERISVE